MSKKSIFILCFLIISSISYSQKNYLVTKDGSGNFKTIKEVNSAKFNNGDIVSFKSGEQFDDAILECSSGITYNSYGGAEKAKIGNSAKSGFKTTIIIEAEAVLIDNLHILGYRDASRIVVYFKGDFTIKNCEINGGENFAINSTIGIKGEVDGITKPIIITKNEIHSIAYATYLRQPYNVDVSYNLIHNIYRYPGYKSVGGMGIYASPGNTIGDKPFNSNYTFHVHHNEIYDFEHQAVYTGPISRSLVEYNDIHNNLDERIYQGGVDNGTLGKIIENQGMTEGSVGTIIRYNYIHDIKKYGEVGHTYSRPTIEQVKAGKMVVTSTSNGEASPLYSQAGNYDGTSSLHISPYQNIIGGGGYGNHWIHNNLFYRIGSTILSRGHNYFLNSLGTTDTQNGKIAPKRDDLGAFFLNNTVLDCGNSYMTLDKPLIYTHPKSQSPTYVYNNIFDYSHPNGRYSLRFEYDGFINYNIYTRNSNSQIGGSQPDKGDMLGTWFQYANNLSTGSNEHYKTNPNWSNPNSTIFVANIGDNGSYLPDVRLSNIGNAIGSGLSYSLLGDKYNVFGQDPTGRSFAYDILGNYRTTNDIGAFGSVDIITQDNAEKPVITKQPVSVSVNSGANALFEVNASSEDQIGYEWWKSPYISDLESKIVDNSKYSGAASNKLTINNIQTEDLNVGYVCKVYNTKDKSNLWINSNIVLLTINSDEVSRLNQGNGLKVYLEGAYSNGKLKSILQTSDALPQFQPYEQSPWNLKDQNGSTDGKDSIVDWIIVEIRDDIRNTAQSKSALLLEDGKIINTDGSDFSMNNISSGDYYLAIRHRNHLDVMSAQKIKIENNASINYDFTVSQDLVYGTNPLAMLGDGKLAMFAGDTDANNVINNLDFGTVANNIPLKGYSNGDLDMNGVVNVLDYTYINKNIFKKTFIP